LASGRGRQTHWVTAAYSTPLTSMGPGRQIGIDIAANGLDLAVTSITAADHADKLLGCERSLRPQRLIPGTLQHGQARILGEVRVGGRTFAAIEGRAPVRRNPAHKLTIRAQTNAHGMAFSSHLYRITLRYTAAATQSGPGSPGSLSHQEQKCFAIKPIRKIHRILTQFCTESP
jgi:hypothetical protein